MLAYLSVWIVLAFYAYKEVPYTKENLSIKYGTVSTALLLLIGFRQDISCDWDNYLRLFENSKLVPFSFIFHQDQYREAGYYFLNWLIANLGLSIYALNFITSILFLVPLILFCKKLSRPFLSLLVAYPYFIVVIGMGFVRQAIAISIIMLALQKLESNKLFLYFILIALAGNFHRASLIFFLMPILANISINFNNLLERKKTIQLSLVLISLLLVILPKFWWGIDQLEYYILRYDGKSPQAIYILLLNLIPSIIFLKESTKISQGIISRKIWQIFSLGSVFIFFGLFIDPTITYRMSLYIIPIQLYVGSEIPRLKLFSIEPEIWKIILISLTLIILITWLNFANHSTCWVPYKNILIPN